MKDRAEGIIRFMDTVEKLCYVKRYTLMADGRRETDSDHIMKLCFLAMMVAPYIKKPVDVQKMLEMALVHDLVEADVGDISFFDQMDTPALRDVKGAREMKAIEKYRKELPEPLGEKLYALFMEYEGQETLEAKIVHTLDIFDGNLQCNKEDNGARYYGRPGVGRRVRAMSEHKYGDAADEDIIRAIEDVLVAISKGNMEKCQKEKGGVPSDTCVDNK